MVDLSTVQLNAVNYAKKNLAVMRGRWIMAIAG
jgi:hypothetical protein